MIKAWRMGLLAEKWKKVIVSIAFEARYKDEMYALLTLLGRVSKEERREVIEKKKALPNNLLKMVKVGP